MTLSINNVNDEYVMLSFEGLELEVLTVILDAAKIFQDTDSVWKHVSGDFRISADMMGRVLELGQMARELITLMQKRGESKDQLTNPEPAE